MSQSSTQYHAFIKEILEHKKVWSVKDEQGFTSSTNPNGETTIPFWSLKSRAEKIIKTVPAYSKFQPHEISIEDFVNRLNMNKIICKVVQLKGTISEQGSRSFAKG